MSLHRTIPLVGPDSRAIARVVKPGRACVASTRRDRDEGKGNRPERNTLCNVWDPVLLAGPIVRRMEPGNGRVWIWLATSVPVEVEARVGAAPNVAPEFWEVAADRVFGHGEAQSYRAGRRLHISLVPIKLDDEIEHPGHWRSPPPAYNMTLTIPEDADYAFESEGNEVCAIHQSQVALDGCDYPTLPFPVAGVEGRQETRFLHASCRKPHAKVEDTISRLLMHLDDKAQDAYQRPTALFFTGDQIYADDVHGELIEPITQLAQKIVGKETLPGDDHPTHEHKKNQRAQVVEGGFSSGHADNHLLGYSEFAAMYLLAWSGDMWQLYVPEPHDDFADYAPADAQRLLANIPTYMIYDDHEVTDDWNLNHAWYQRAWNDPVTRRIVTNGLTAFAVFQGEGNDPQRFEEQLRPGISWSGILMEPGSHPDIWSDEQAWQTHWNYVAGTPQPVIVLDTRMQRLLMEGVNVPGLQNAAALEWVADQLSELSTKPEEPVLLVSPAPVLGYELIEDVQMKLAKHDRPAALDSEAWSLHATIFSAFLNLLYASEFRRFVFLSGDVHHGFVAAGRYETPPSPPRRHGPDAIEFAQFTSSPSKNDSRSVFDTVGGDKSLIKSWMEQVQTFSLDTVPWHLKWSYFDVTTETNVGHVMIDGEKNASQSLSLASGTKARVVEWGNLPYVDF